MQADDSSRLSASPDMHCVWLCSHRLLRGGGRVGAHTLYAYWGFVHTLAVSWDIPPSGIVIGVTSILEVCLMRSQPCADLLYEAKTPAARSGGRRPIIVAWDCGRPGAG